jgi:hypothetical protein
MIELHHRKGGSTAFFKLILPNSDWIMTIMENIFLWVFQEAIAVMN